MKLEKISRDKLINFGIEFLTTKGVPEETAEKVVDIIADTESMGIHTHGVKLFPYFDTVIPKDLNPKAEPEIVREKSSIALIDSNSGFSQIAMIKAKEIAKAKAKETGISMVGIKNSLWMGAVGPYLVSLAKEGFFAHLWAQTSTCVDCAPFGGTEGRFSTNPIGLAFPTKPSGESPIFADFSTASMSVGKMNTLIKENQKAPEDSFLDREGSPTNDPNVVPKGGTLLFFGGINYGYKGYALSLWIEALTAMVGGSANNPASPTRQTIILMVIDPNAFEGRDYYYREMERFLKHVKSSKLRPGIKEIRFPGERALKEQEKSQREGISIDTDVLDSLRELSRKYSLSNSL